MDFCTTTYVMLVFHTLITAYARKPDVIDNEASKYSVTGTDNYTKHLLSGFCKLSKIKGGNVSLDRYFTSVPLTKSASANNFKKRGLIVLVYLMK